MRVLGLDIGEKRIGVAVSDARGNIATPLTVIDAAEAYRDGAPLARLIEDYEVTLVVIGLPLSLDGSEGPQARRVRTLAARLAEHAAVPFDFIDERLSSAEAGRRMRDAGLSERDQRGSKDMVAAAIFLQSYLDAHPAEPSVGLP